MLNVLTKIKTKLHQCVLTLYKDDVFDVLYTASQQISPCYIFKNLHKQLFCYSYFLF